ncbi:sensor histidine kinase [Mesobaculum littorinae]|uniref:sensor histidine kinase n=1 Tax=Mesobaculum littorinae TaxID=2486419 RepID=UPI0013E367C5|nr:ATP-binding protein [Mesobaculum littorinae]
MNRPKNAKQSAAIYLTTIAAVSILGFLTTYYLQRAYLRSYTASLRAELSDQSYRVAEALRQEIFRMELVTRGLAGTISVTPDLTQDQFEAFARPLINGEAEGMQLAVAPNLEVTYVYPEEGNRNVIGMDYRIVPSQLVSVNESRRKRTPVLSGPVSLVQGGRGYILRHPVYVPDPVTGNTTFWGVVSLVLPEKVLLADAGFRDAGPGYITAMRRMNAAGQPERMMAGAPAVFERDAILQTIDLPDGDIQLGIAPAGGWPLVAPNAGWIAGIVLTIVLCIVGIVTAIHRLARGREEARQTLLHSIESLDDGFAIYDEEDRLAMCNRKYIEIYSRAAKVIRPGTTFSEIVRYGVAHGQYPEAEGREEEFIAERFAAHRAGNRIVEERLPDGRWLKICEKKTRDNYTAGVWVDVTELKQAREEAEDANRAKSEFFANVSHELRTPLTIILGYTSFLSNPEVLPDYAAMRKAVSERADADPEILRLHDRLVQATQTYNRKIQSSARHLLTMVNEILDWAQIEHGRMSFEYGELRLDELVGEVCEEFRTTTDGKGIGLHCNAEEVTLDGDAVRLKQLLYNLVGNAVKFTSEGSVTLSAWAEGDMVRIQVSDTGCGIPEADAEAIFERFRQVDGSATRRHGGTGLGLSIARFIAEHHGGDITLSSAVNEGTTFDVILARSGSRKATARLAASDTPAPTDEDRKAA